MKSVLILGVVLLFLGCSIKQKEFRYLSLQQCQKAPWKDVGVADVELPDYFIDDRFPYRENGVLGYLEERLARNPSFFLTNCAAKMLGGCAYPWECEKKPKKIYRIKIEEFYYDRQRNKIVLIAQIDHKEFRIEKEVRSDPLHSALIAYKKLITQIGR